MGLVCLFGEARMSTEMCAGRAALVDPVFSDVFS